MLADAPDEAEVIPEFLSSAATCPCLPTMPTSTWALSWRHAGRLGIEYDPTYVDTLILAQNLLPDLKNHKLNIVADALSLPEFNHHRAVDDGVTVAHMLRRFFEMLREQGMRTSPRSTRKMVALRSGSHILDRQARHMILFAKNQTGLAISTGWCPIPTSNTSAGCPGSPSPSSCSGGRAFWWAQACEAGELFQAIVAHKSRAE